MFDLPQVKSTPTKLTATILDFLVYQVVLSNTIHWSQFPSSVSDFLGFYRTLFTPDMHEELLSGSSSVLQENINNDNQKQ